MTIKIDPTKIRNAAIAAFRETTLLYAAECSKVISDNNAFPEYPGQDIVDSGRLRASQQIVFLDETTAEIRYPVDYALYVHEGVTGKDGKALPGRPWTRVAATRLGLQKTFNAQLRKQLK